MTSPISAPLAYTDYASLTNQVREDQQGIEDAAKHFESVFIDMWLKAAREANAAISEDNFMNTSEMAIRQEMFDHEMAVHMVQNGGIGLAPVIIRQLGGTADIPLRQTSTADMVNAHAASEASSAAVTLTSNASKSQAFAGPEEFVTRLKPIVDRITAVAGLPALAVLSQAALETGWGSQVIRDGDGNLSHNLFGIKSRSDDEAQVAIHSKEFEFGRWIDRVASFRAYPDWESSVRDYANMLMESPRYKEAVAKASDAVEFLRGLQSAGYATDPKYADKIISVMNRVVTLGG